MHIALILDGNRRYAKKHKILPWKGHEKGAEVVEKLFDWCFEIGDIDQLTLYVFSMENFNRSKDEVKYLMKLFERAFKKFQKREHKVRFNFIGRIELFSDKIQKMISEIESKTKDNVGLKCNVAMAYGGRSEIVDAVNKAVDSGTKVDEDSFSKYLYISDEPDIMIRTGGDFRISNFLLWQMSYTELFFLKKLWPEFTKDDLSDIVSQYTSRERRFGQ